MKLAVETITPESAAEMLTKNTGNRKISNARVAILANEMKAGRWQANGESVKLNGDRLLDGQHRLKAVVDSGVPIETVVVRGLPDSVFATIDQQRKRSANDVLARNGEVNTTNLAATIRTIVDLRNPDKKSKRSNSILPNAFFIDMITKEPGIAESLAEVHSRMTTVWRISRGASTPAAFHYLFGQSHPTLRDEFFHKLDTGEGAKEGDPVWLLRQRLIENCASSRPVERTIVMAWYAKSWAATVKGTPMRILKWSPGKEEFPEIVGQ